MRRLVLFLLFLITLTGIPAAAQSDDITQMGKVSPLFYLENAFREDVSTAAGEQLSVEISSIVSEQERILIRFFVTGLSESWQEKITDDLRLYGSYLPIAEVLTEQGSFLTPSSASRYSFLEYNDQMIIGGLLIFQTKEAPQTFYLNFNQIPFDTEPLAEGFTRPIILDPVPETYNSTGAHPRDNHQGLEFTLSAAAQTNNTTMLQPAVHMDREDEKLSKFGWITISDTSDSKRYPVTRGSLYGFNLTDDTSYSPAHAYVFAPLSTDAPITVSMDHAYVIRTFSSPQKSTVRFSDDNTSVIILDNDFNIRIYDVISQPDEDRIRILIDCGNSQISDISFVFDNLIGISQPSVNCGLDTANGDFACDIYFDDISFPLNEITFEINAVEYRKDGPWEFKWNPVQMSVSGEEKMPVITPDFQYTSQYPFTKEQPEEVQTVLDRMEQLNQSMIEEPGWICESYELNYQFTDKNDHDLISADRYGNYRTHYISETWHHVENDSHISEVLTLTREPDSGSIISAQWQRPGNQLDLVHALLTITNEPSVYSFRCFEDFRNIAESTSSYFSHVNANDDNNDSYQIRFVQSLSGLPESANNQITEFKISSQDHFILQEKIRYDQMGLELLKTTITLEKRESLPDDILDLMGTVK